MKADILLCKSLHSSTASYERIIGIDANQSLNQEDCNESRAQSPTL